ncbi:MAG: ParB/RepB/Spo0J family partition protein, partial [Planctomycetaceae bacterium]|nr:ParB/RepB/Spo0J family partition protein [Planctomycetaceae bacterium]
MDSVRELAKSIAKLGLQIPLIVQPACDVEEGLPEGKEWRVVCGHRRLMAVSKLLGWVEIPVTIRRGLTQAEAKELNIIENLERKDLNIMEESQVIQDLYPNGVKSVNSVAKRLGKSRLWVSYRLRFATLNYKVQKQIAAGMINKSHIDILAECDPKEQDRLAQRLVKRDGESKRQKNKPRKKVKPTVADVLRMIDYLFRVEKEGLPTKLLAWTLGNISTEEVFDEIDNDDPRTKEREVNISR